jgi:hypothetical protein
VHLVYSNHTTFPIVSLADKRPHKGRRTPVFPSIASSSPLTRFLDKNSSKMEKISIGYENLQTIYQRKALGEENTVEHIIFSLMCYKSLASKEKEIGCGIQLGDLGGD